MMLGKPNSNAVFVIDNFTRTFSIKDSPTFQYGRDEILSSEATDITFGQLWYDEGYTEIDFLNQDEFSTLKTGLQESIRRIVEEEVSSELDGFCLENYHHFVKSDSEHFRIVSRTRDLFSKDFNFSITSLFPRLDSIMGFELTDIDPKLEHKIHIIVRINRPKSNDYNPPHKDIYEGVDKFSYIPPFVNFWIPIAGVNQNSNLPIAPKSHKISEREIFRTVDGGVIEGNKYRVRMIQSWGGKNSLIRSQVKYGQVLIFSSHLIHGLGVNDNDDITRVALEFRLYKNLELNQTVSSIED